MYGAYKNASTLASAVKNAPEGYSWGQRLTAIPRMLKAAFTGRWRDANRFGLTLSLVGMIYVLSPLDFIPELLFGPLFGLGDDIAIAAASVAYLVKSTDRWLESSTEVTAAPTTPPSTGTFTGDVIQGTVIQSGTEERSGS